MVFRFFRNIIGARSTAAAIGQGFLANGLLLLLNVVTGVITARALGPEGRGEVAALVAVPTLLTFIGQLGFSSAVVFELHRGNFTANTLKAGTLLLSFPLAILATLAALVLTPITLENQTVSVIEFATKCSWFVAPQVVALLAMGALLGENEFAKANIIRVAQPTVALLGLFCLIATQSISPKSVAVVTLGSGLPGWVWVVWLVWPKYLTTVNNMQGALSSLTTYALRACSGDVLSALAVQLDKVVIVSLYSPTEIGLLTVAMSLSRLLLVAPQAITPVLFPVSAGRSAEEVINVVTRTAAVTLVITAGAAIFLSVFGTLLLEYIYSKAFTVSIALFLVLLLESIVTALHQVLTQAFLALNKPGAIAVQQTAGLTITLLLLVVWSQRHGLYGAAVALLAGAIVRLILALVMFRFGLNLPMPKIMCEVVPSVTELWRRIRNGTL
jgi:O-antigen/teichoic acid export membrane protein